MNNNIIYHGSSKPGLTRLDTFAKENGQASITRI